MTRRFDPYPHLWRLPLILWQGAFFVIPLIFMAAMSFWLVKNYKLEPNFVFDN
jgi:spermidine/putrescine transport system permease protein